MHFAIIESETQVPSLNPPSYPCIAKFSYSKVSQRSCLDSLSSHPDSHFFSSTYLNLASFFSRRLKFALISAKSSHVSQFNGSFSFSSYPDSQQDRPFLPETLDWFSPCLALCSFPVCLAGSSSTPDWNPRDSIPSVFLLFYPFLVIS